MIVDDNHHFRKSFKLYLSKFDNIEIIMEAENGIDFFNKIKKTVPDIVFMDIDMPKLNGIETTAKASLLYRYMKIIALTFHSEMDYVKDIIAAGACNYIVKDEINDNVISDIMEINSFNKVE